MTRDQLRSKILQVLTYTLEEGLDVTAANCQLQCIADAKTLGLGYKEFNSITRTDILHMKNDPVLTDLLLRFCEFMVEELEEKKDE